MKPAKDEHQPFLTHVINWIAHDERNKTHLDEILDLLDFGEIALKISLSNWINAFNLSKIPSKIRQIFANSDKYNSKVFEAYKK